MTGKPQPETAVLETRAADPAAPRGIRVAPRAGSKRTARPESSNPNHKKSTGARSTPLGRKSFDTPTPWPADAIERRTVAALIPYARNARKHKAKQVAEITASKRCRSSRPPTPPPAPPFSRLLVLAAPRPASGFSRPHPAPQGRGRAVGRAGTLDRIQALRATTCGLGCRGDQSSGSGSTAARRTASASVSAAAGFAK